MTKSLLKLPPLTGGGALEVEDSARQIVVVGANGAGKSRFTACLTRSVGDKAYTLSALNAIFGRSSGSTGNAVIDELYELSLPAGRAHSVETSQFDRVLTLLMHDEMLNLIGYKLRLRTSADAQLQPTRLDTVIDVWEQVFPGNKILIESGRILFARRHGGGGDDLDSYQASRLSAGEKTVLYYLGAMSYAPKRSTVFVDSPEMFLHPTVARSLWNHIEMMRPDCRFVYTTHDLDFAASRSASSAVWVRNFDPRSQTWDYEVLPPTTILSDEIYRSILGSRKPVLFIEGDERHSIDAKLYPLIFRDFTVRALGSCNKVIEATRTFNDLNSFHHLDSRGIVDRDRRDAKEVEYLRGKRIMVPEVAEVENLLLVEEVVRTVATHCGKDGNSVATKVRNWVLREFRSEYKQQALLHTRHKVKRIVECRIDGRFASIEMLERHLVELPDEIKPRQLYDNLCNEFRRYATTGDYPAVLRVYNRKSMLPGCNVAGLCGLRDKDDYLYMILRILRRNSPESDRIRQAILNCFNVDSESLINHEDDNEA